MPSLPPASILVVEPPTAPQPVYSALIDDEHSVDVVRTDDELAAITTAYDLVFIDDRHPDIDAAAIDHLLTPQSKLTRITDSIPVEQGGSGAYDDHLVRPVTAWSLERTITSLRTRQAYVERVDEHFEVAQRLAELEAGSSDTQAKREHRALKSKADELESELSTLFETLSSLGEPAKIFYDLQPDPAAESSVRPPAIVY